MEKVIKKVTEIISRVKFLIWVYSYRVKKTVTDYLINKKLTDQLNEINSNIKRIDSQVRRLEYADIVVSNHYAEKDSLIEELHRLNRKVKRYERLKNPKRTGTVRSSKNSRRQNSSRSRK